MTNISNTKTILLYGNRFTFTSTASRGSEAKEEKRIETRGEKD